MAISSWHASIVITNPMTEVWSNHSQIGRSLIDRLQQGDDDAIGQLFAAYSDRLAHMAARNISPGLLRRFDGEDVVQSVFRTFFRRHEQGKLAVQHREQLWKLLVTITILKTRTHARRHTAEKRNAAAEQALPESFDFLDQQPTPEDALALWEEIEVALVDLPDKAWDILALRLEGHPKSEIAKQLGVSRQTVHRLCDLLKQRLANRFQEYEIEPDPENL